MELTKKQIEMYSRRIAAYIYADSLMNTSNGSWSVYEEELNHIIDIDNLAISDSEALQDAIIEELYKYEGIAEVETYKDDFNDNQICYSLSLYSDYCPSYIRRINKKRNLIKKKRRIKDTMKYTKIKQIRREELEKFPLGFAFNDKQFEEMMKEFGLKVTDTDKIVYFGAGGYMKKTDLEAYKALIKRHNKEHYELLNNDEEYARTAFRYEFSNHECGYTGDFSPALSALGITYKYLEANERLEGIFYAVQDEFLRDCD